MFAGILNCLYMKFMIGKSMRIRLCRTIYLMYARLYVCLKLFRLVGNKNCLSVLKISPQIGY